MSLNAPRGLSSVEVRKNLTWFLIGQKYVLSCYIINNVSFVIKNSRNSDMLSKAFLLQINISLNTMEKFFIRTKFVSSSMNFGELIPSCY